MVGICFYLTQSQWFRLTVDYDLSGQYNYSCCHMVAPISSGDLLFLFWDVYKHRSWDLVVSSLCTCGCMDPLMGH